MRMSTPPDSPEHAPQAHLSDVIPASQESCFSFGGAARLDTCEPTADGLVEAFSELGDEMLTDTVGEPAERTPAGEPVLPPPLEAGHAAPIDQMMPPVGLVAGARLRCPFCTRYSTREDS